MIKYNEEKEDIMKQYDLINKIIDNLVKKKYIHYAFLKGSFASGNEDVYSNVDIYIKLRVEKEDDFFNSYLSIFESYKPIIFYKVYDYEKIVFVYKDLINLNIYFIDDLKNLDINQAIVKLYDPDNLLEDIYDYSLELTNNEIGNIVDEMSMKCYDFYRLFLRNEYAVIMHVLADIHKLYSCILHYYYKKEDSKLGLKNLICNLGIDERKRYLEILKNWNLDNVKNCVLMMMEDVIKIIETFNVNIANHFNFDFFNEIKGKIFYL